MPLPTPRAFLFLALGLVLSLPGTSTAATFSALMQKLPDGANVIVVVNVAQILNSEFARSHGSQQRLAKAFEERSVLIPPHAARFVLGANMDIERQTRVWEAAVIEMQQPPNVAEAARQAHRQVEEISGLQAIGAAKAFLLGIGGNEVGVFVPSSRQQAARWARQLTSNSGRLSSYLAKTGSYADTAGTDIILAVDLTDVFPQKYLAERLRGHEALKGHTVDVEKAAAALASVQGARLGIKIGSACRAKLVVDFKDDPAAIADIAKPVLVTALGNAGLMLDEFQNWKVSVGPRSVALDGILTDDGLRRVMSVVEIPQESVATIEPTSAAEPSSTSSNSESLKVDASRAYFKAIQTQLDSVRLRQSEAKTVAQVGGWIDNIARRIDRMSSLNVDDDLLDYGATVTNELRQMVASVQGIGIQSGQRVAGIYNNDSYYYGSNRDTSSARRQARAQETATGATSARDISRQIAAQTAAIRRKMTDRYKVDF